MGQSLICGGVESFCRSSIYWIEELTINFGSSRNNNAICNLQESVDIPGSNAAASPYWYVRNCPLNSLQPFPRFRVVSPCYDKPIRLPEPDSLVSRLFKRHTGQRHACPVMDISKYGDIFGSDGTAIKQYLTSVSLHDTFRSNHSPNPDFDSHKDSADGLCYSQRSMPIIFQHTNPKGKCDCGSDCRAQHAQPRHGLRPNLGSYREITNILNHQCIESSLGVGFRVSNRPLYEFLAECTPIINRSRKGWKPYHSDQGMLLHPVRCNYHVLTSSAVSVVSRRIASPRSIWKA